MQAATRACGVLILFLIATARPALSQSKPEETKTPALKEFTNSLGMKFVLIPAGEFMMGDDEWDNNKPHQVRITKPFYMQAMLVTQSQFAKVMGRNPSSHKDGDETKLPVDSISWNTAQEFVKKLNADPSVHGILVQMPLPKHLDQIKVITAIDPAKDVDGLHPESFRAHDKSRCFQTN